MAQISQKLYGGVEGGASFTKFVLVGADGKVLSSTQGQGTNQYLIGLDECLKRINALVKDGLKSAGLPEDTTLEGLGLSLSGGDVEEVQKEIKAAVMKDYPALSRHVYVGSDTDSALATALPRGGIVMIAGTGSNCQLINPDGSSARCGGLGHMVGDEASAIWIALRAIKIYFDNEDGFEASEHSVEEVEKTIFRYFNIDNRYGLLSFLYSDFVKAKIAGLCKELADVCFEKQDPLCCALFRDAGRMVAKHLVGVSSKIHEELKNGAGGVPVLCQGSVFKSWSLMEKGFVDEMTARISQSGVQEVTMKQLKVEASFGAAALGAKACGVELPLDYNANASVMYHKKF
ncbi:N-acetyl-D-glucosamine kinase [Aplysia californica]|uniref:N-acetyl-D-glucosamine kinase n=1 Tax=Aplysia californica TaxID=6500 RepID=A0ABM0JQ12_APLCA|nr:N-acetyl-D-glucosamine kinase [Aplysia californica]